MDWEHPSSHEARTRESQGQLGQSWGEENLWAPQGPCPTGSRDRWDKGYVFGIPWDERNRRGRTDRARRGEKKIKKEREKRK